jgi:superfamily II DNA or RNA helicase
MTLASMLSHLVDWRVRERGRHYFQTGRVQLTECGPEVARAAVTGSDEYQVSLTREGAKLWAFCSCPFFAGGATCKHVWAAILAADERKGLRGPDGDLPRKLMIPGAVAERAQPTPPQPPTWRDTLDELARQTPAPAPSAAASREILYLLDVPATLKSERLTLQLLSGAQNPDGSWEKLAPMSVNRDEVPGLPDAGDQQCLSLLAPLGVGATRWSATGYSSLIPTRCEIPPPTASVLLPLLSATGRFRARLNKDSNLSVPVTWYDGPPWEIWLEVHEEANGYCRMTASLRRGGERLPAETTFVLGSSGFLLAGGRVSRLADGAFRWASLLSPDQALRVPTADREELLERLLASPDLPRLELPESMRFEETQAIPRPRLRLLPPTWGRGSLRAELSFLYEGREVQAGSTVRGVYYREERRFLLRDLEAERRSAGRLPDLGFRPDTDPLSSSGSSSRTSPPPLKIHPGRVPKAVSALLAEGWSVEAEGKLYRTAGRFKMNVSSGVDWFELHGEADFEGTTVRLPELLAALRRGQKFIPLSDGTLGVLPEEWIQQLAPVARLGEAEGDHLRFGSVQAALLDAWLEDEPEVTADEAFERARERLHGFAGIAPAEAPPGFQGELRGYQRAGLGWLHFLRDFGFGGCLADDMGLGKTVQVLALLEARRTLREGIPRESEKLPPSLVVVPRSLVFNWIAEAANFTPRLRVLDYTGAGRAREGDPFAAPAQGDYDVVLTTYGTLRKDVAALRRMEFDYVILDEAQAIKNAESQTAKAARLLRGRHRLALTGTPVENHLGELWSLLEFLNPGFLGASPTFRQHADEMRAPMAENQGMLARALRPLILRRTKEAVAPELPAKLEQTLYCVLPPRQRRLYDELRDHYRGSLGSQIGERGLGRSKILVLEALLRLRQAACHPGLVDPRRASEPSAKLDLLLPQLREVLDEGHKALVFSQFTSFLALLRQRLDAEGTPYLYLDGRTRDRQEKVEAFQSDPESRLFLISLKAGGLGLNLTAADYVYLLDPWWNPAVESQAIDRAHRIGQVRPVFASRIVARDTVEEKILELQKTKRDLADAVIQADRSLISGLSREDLEMLLS